MGRSNCQSRLAQEALKANVHAIRPAIEFFLRECEVSIRFVAGRQGGHTSHVEARRPSATHGVAVHQWSLSRPPTLAGSIAVSDPATVKLIQQLLPTDLHLGRWGFPNVPSLGCALWNKSLDEPFRAFAARIRDLGEDGARPSMVASARKTMGSSATMMVMCGMSKEEIMREFEDVVDLAVVGNVMSA